MKKLLFLFAFAVIGWMSSLANEATITFADKGYANAEKLTTVVVNEDVTLTFSKGSGSTDPAYYNTGSAARLYGSNTLTISAPGFEITNITFTCGSSNGMGSGFTAAPGELQDGVWTGTASEVVITNGNSSGHARIESIAITYAPLGADVVANPVFAPAAGQVLAGTEVAIACATEGATVYYTTDETVPTAASTAYTAPIAINDYTVIKAIAIKGENTSDVVTAEYSLIPEVESLTSIIDFPDGTKFIVASDLNIVYAEGSNVYVKEGANPGLIYGNVPGAEAGKVIKKGWIASYKNYNGVPEIMPVDTPEVVEGDGSLVEPTPVEAEDAGIALIASNVNAYVNLQGVFISDFSTTTFTGLMGDITEVTFYKKFSNIEYPEVAGNYNVTGFVTVYKGNVQIYPTAFELVPPTIESLTALTDIPTNYPVVVGMDLTVIENSGMFTIVYDGTTYGAVAVSIGNLTPGDIIEAGWNATTYYDVLMAATAPATKTGGTIPAVREYEANDIAQTTSAFNYVCYLNVTLDAALDVEDPIALAIATTLDGEQEADLIVYNALGETLEAGTYNLVGFWMPADVMTDGNAETSALPTYLFYITGTQPTIVTIESLSSLVDIPNDTPVVVDMELTVVADAGIITLVYDGTMYGGVALSIGSLTPGDIIEAGWEATVHNGALMVKSAPATKEGGTIPEIAEYDAADIASTMYPFSYLNYANVVIDNEIDANDMGYGTAIALEGDDEVSIFIYNGLAEAITPETYNLTGFWLPGAYFEMEGVDYLFWVTDAQCTTPIIESLSALADIPNNTAVLVNMPLTVAECTENVIIVWDGTMYGGVNIWTAQLEPGDIIEAGWYASVYYGCLMAGGRPTIAEGGEVPEVRDFEAADVAQTTTAFNYACYLNVDLAEDLDAYNMTLGIAMALEGDETADLVVYNTTAEAIEAGVYNLTGFWMPTNIMLEGQAAEMGLPELMFFIIKAEAVVEPMTMEEVEGTYLITKQVYETLDNDYVWQAETYAGDIITITATETGVEITNLIGWEEVVEGTIDLAKRTITIPVQEFDYGMIAGLNAAGEAVRDAGGYWLGKDDANDPFTIVFDEEGNITISPFMLFGDYGYDDYYLWAIVNGETADKVFIPADPYEIYLRGTMNGWGADADCMFTSYDNVWYYLENANIEAGVEFKFATEDWSTIDFGGLQDMKCGEYYTLVNRGSNCTLAESLTNGTIWLNALSGEVYFEQGIPTGINGIEAANGEAEFFNLQGVKVANPKAGNVYIRVADGKASKVVVK